MLIDSQKLKQAILTIMPERSEVLLIVDSQTEGIVRCKECQHMSSPDGYFEYCNRLKKFVDMEWFCADGKRKCDDLS